MSEIKEQKAQEARKLTLHYALIQAAFWMGYMSIRAYTTQYLADRGLSYTLIGVLYAVASIGSVMMQTGLSGLIDSSPKVKLRSVTLSLVGLVLALGGMLTAFEILGVERPIMTALLYGFMLLILYGLQSFITSLCYEFINHGIPVNFGLARGVGSITCAVINVIVGNLVAVYGSGVIFFPLLGFFIALMVLIVTFRLRGRKVHSGKPVEFHLKTGDTSHSSKTHKKHQGSSAAFFRRNPKFALFLVSCFFSMTAYQCINSYMINIATNVGGGSRTVGYVLAIAAAVELPAMVCFNWLRKKLGVTRLLRFAGFFFIMKALLMLVARSESMMYLAALMQMFSFGIFLPASTYFANEAVQAEDRVKAQAMISASTVGLAMTVGSLFGGTIIDYRGIRFLLAVCVAFASIGWGIMIFVTKRVEKSRK